MEYVALLNIPWQLHSLNQVARPAHGRDRLRDFYVHSSWVLDASRLKHANSSTHMCRDKTSDHAPGVIRPD